MSYRILHIFSGYGGGVASCIGNLSKNRIDGFEFDFLAFSYKGGDTFVSEMEGLGIKVFTMPRPRVEGYGKFKQYVSDIMRSGNYDAVHCHITGWRVKVFFDIAKKNSIKVFVTHAHSTTCDNRFDRLGIVRAIGKRINYKCSDMYMTCSDLAAEYMFGEKYLAKKELFLIPNGADITKFEDKLTAEERQEYNREFGLSDSDFIIMHVGRFTLPKNHPMILDIMSKLKNAVSNARLIFVGDGELLGDVQSKAAEMNLSDTVIFAGRRLDIPKLMQYADLMILPSFNEGLPTVAVECQAAGTPMLLSDTITRQCDMGVGLIDFLPIKSADAWVDKIQAFLDAPRAKKEGTTAVIDDNGFSATAAGRNYCLTMKKLIDSKMSIENG